LPEAEDRDVRLGQLAFQTGFVTESDLEEALLEQERRAEEGFQAMLGELLVEMGLLTERQLDRLLAAQAVVHAKVSRIGPYHLIAKLGEGGMGAVYQARDARTGEFVALKVLPRSKARDPSFLARFEQESRAVFELDHPNIVRAVGMGEADGYHYLATEYVDGMDVYDILEEKGRIPEIEAISIAMQITQAVEHAADEQVVHRDIKPGNILVDRHGMAKLTDFGLALDRDRIGRGRITEGDGALGTPFYLSPELARGELDIDVRSDIYSLGATLYEMVTGQPPFEGPPIVVMSKHLREQIPSPSDIDRTLSTGICQVIQKMMAKRREDRYQTAHELLRDLMLVYEGRNPVSARLPSDRSSVRPSVRAPRRRARRLVGAARHDHRRRSRPPLVAKGDQRAAGEAEETRPRARDYPAIRVTIPYRTTLLVAVGAALVAALAVHLAISLRPSGGYAPLPASVAPPPGGGPKLNSDFESGTSQGWLGTVFAEGAGEGKYSLRVPAAPAPHTGLATCASGAALGDAAGLNVRFLYYYGGRGPIVVEIFDPTSGVRLRGAIPEPVRGTWAPADVASTAFVRVPQVTFETVEEGAAPAGQSDQRGVPGLRAPRQTVAVGAPEARPADILALDSIWIWSE
jgi:serine/threonine-protein kinase